jgi:hypothetical protein
VKVGIGAGIAEETCCEGAKELRDPVEMKLLIACAIVCCCPSSSNGVTNRNTVISIARLQSMTAIKTSGRRR